MRDMDSDGHMDVLVADRGTFIWYRNFDGNRIVPLEINSGYPFDGALIPVDFDLDGDLDLIAGFVYPKVIVFSF